MSLVVMGLSHRTSPLELLERASLDSQGIALLRAQIRACEHVVESVVVATCNRLEVYADSLTFHGAVDAIGSAVAEASGVPREELAAHLYVHYEDRAIAHAFSTACGLDSMAVGEGQILGQMRQALAAAQECGAAGKTLNQLFQHALRVGKKAHSDTAIDRAGPSLVEGALTLCEQAIGDVRAARVVVVGAGAMSSLAATSLARAGITDVVVINRTRAKADRLAATLGVASADWSDLGQHIQTADIILACTGAAGYVVTAELAQQAHRVREQRPQVYVDLAVPRDIDPDVARYATVVDLAGVGDYLRVEAGEEPAVAAVRDLVTAEVADFIVLQRQIAIAPVVAALRQKAADVVAAEMARLDAKLPNLDEAARREVENTVHRVASKLMHAPTVRAKELASVEPVGDYSTALRELFDLDSRTVSAVSTACGPGWPG